MRRKCPKICSLGVNIKSKLMSQCRENFHDACRLQIPFSLMENQYNVCTAKLVQIISTFTEASPDEPKPRLVEDVTKDLEKANEFDIWGPVGGLEDVKQELTECIFWPIMVRKNRFSK